MEATCDSGGSYTGELYLARWFGSDCQAHGPGRGVWRGDEWTLCLPHRGALRLDKLIVVLVCSVILFRVGQGDCCSTYLMEGGWFQRCETCFGFTPEYG